MSLAIHLRRVCELQPFYSSSNTSEMKERGDLIRRLLVSDLMEHEDDLREALGYFGDDFGIEGSDGIGRKTEAPWVRIFSRGMSPSAREGYYVVIHFAADGSAVFITVGCGSTIWADGDLTPVSDDELRKRTNWAKKAITERLGGFAPFEDQIRLGAKAALPRTFEKATAVAKKILYEAIDEDDFRSLTVAATKLLSCLYEAQRSGSDQSPANLVELDVELLTRPSKAKARGQGYHLSSDDRECIEMHAMRLAEEWLGAEGFSVIDHSRRASYDHEAKKGDTVLKIEVKGTTADSSDSILMTRNEVDLHRRESGKTGLIIVTCIQLDRSVKPTRASGGKVTAELGWDILKWDVEATAFKVSRPMR